MRMNRAHAIDNKLNLHWKIARGQRTRARSCVSTRFREASKSPAYRQRVAGGRDTDAGYKKTGVRLLYLFERADVHAFLLEIGMEPSERHFHTDSQQSHFGWPQPSNAMPSMRHATLAYGFNGRLHAYTLLCNPARSGGFVSCHFYFDDCLITNIC